MLKKHAKFCLFAADLDEVSRDIQEMKKLIKLKASTIHSSSSTRKLNEFFQELPQIQVDMDLKLSNLAKEGEILLHQAPVHATAIRMGLSQVQCYLSTVLAFHPRTREYQVQEKWNNLLEYIEEERRRVDSANHYFVLADSFQNHLNQINQSLLNL